MIDDLPDGHCPVCGRDYATFANYDRHIERTSHHLFRGNRFQPETSGLCTGNRPDGLKGWRSCDLPPGHPFHTGRKP